MKSTIETNLPRAAHRSWLVSVALLLFSFALAGCNSTVQYNRVYLGNAQPPAAGTIAGKALLQTTADEDGYVFSGNPTSLTGGGTTMAIPLGRINLESAKLVFSQLFSEGVSVSGEPVPGERYAAIIHPTVTGFEYAYNQLRNAGFAITPQASVGIAIEVRNAAGDIVSARTYESGVRDGDTYFMSSEPAEKINELTHRLFMELFTRAAQDLYDAFDS